MTTARRRLNQAIRDWCIRFVTLSETKVLSGRLLAVLRMTRPMGRRVKCTNVLWCDLTQEVSSPLETCFTRLLAEWGLRLACSLMLVVALKSVGYGEPLSSPYADPPERETHEPLSPIPLPVVEDEQQTRL